MGEDPSGERPERIRVGPHRRHLDRPTGLIEHVHVEPLA
jgi:hypothetical protein